jgi:hypothetical protein
LLQRVVPFVDKEWLIEEAEMFIRDKRGNTLEDSLKYFSGSIGAILKKECIKNKKFLVKDNDIVLIIEKLLETIKRKDSVVLGDDGPLNGEERRKLRNIISQFERNNNKKRLYPAKKVLLCILKSKGRTVDMNIREIREKSGLINFYKSTEDIFEQLEKEGKVTTAREGRKITKISITNKNIRTILGIVKTPSMAEKFLNLLKSK